MFRRFSHSDPTELQYQRQRQQQHQHFAETEDQQRERRGSGVGLGPGSTGSRDQVYFDNRPKTSGDLPSASISHAVQNSLRK